MTEPKTIYTADEQWRRDADALGADVVLDLRRENKRLTAEILHLRSALAASEAKLKTAMAYVPACWQDDPENEEGEA